MTDKQVIIDGVDVSGCNHYKNNGKCRVPHYQQGIKYTCCNCNEWDCYYKQLKRKEQKFEELKEDRERWKSNFNGKVSAIKELLQQLDQLKTKNIKIYKTLTEIKEIAEEQIPYLDIDKAKTITEVEYDYAGKIYNLEQKIYKILQKISECEVK